MLTHPTQERLIALGLGSMAKAFDDQLSTAVEVWFSRKRGAAYGLY